MAGIYIHIPFCKQACHYCNFHFSTSLKQKEPLLQALLTEIEQQKGYLEGEELESIYLGGGTPSLLSAKELDLLFQQIQRFHKVVDGAEITLEANPDDLSREKLQALRKTPINRLSIGIQSFLEEDLRFMNRAHSAMEAEACIDLALEEGFTALTVDLIYGTPTLSHAQWEQNLQKVFEKPIQHLSCYCLTVEPQTALDHFVKTGKAQPVDEEQAAHQFERLIEASKAAGFEQYEISNFARDGYYAVHNSNYWKGKKYLGIGPSAHSFNGKSRQWNIANNSKYIQALSAGELSFELEQLTVDQRYNEYVMTGLRTIWGCEISKIYELSPKHALHFKHKVQTFMQAKNMEEIDGNYRLTEAGRLLADHIAMELFV
ncbi:MAG: radical SAM family heme chaperone HemW [Saprospiraceae bacterium]|nr:radical SAM family heme chaperone HemW [Saprospiraceae bacterium]